MTILQQINENMLDRNPIFDAALEILLQIVKGGVKIYDSERTGLVAYISLEINNLKRYISTPSDHANVSSTYERRAVLVEVFETVMLRCSLTKQRSHVTLYIRHMT